jgi:hypothetical protein
MRRRWHWTATTGAPSEVGSRRPPQSPPQSLSLSLSPQPLGTKPMTAATMAKWRPRRSHRTGAPVVAAHRTVYAPPALPRQRNPPTHPAAVTATATVAAAALCCCQGRPLLAAAAAGFCPKRRRTTASPGPGRQVLCAAAVTLTDR